MFADILTNIGIVILSRSMQGMVLGQTYLGIQALLLPRTEWCLSLSLSCTSLKCLIFATPKPLSIWSTTYLQHVFQRSDISSLLFPKGEKDSFNIYTHLNKTVSHSFPISPSKFICLPFFFSFFLFLVPPPPILLPQKSQLNIWLKAL